MTNKITRDLIEFWRGWALKNVDQKEPSFYHEISSANLLTICDAALRGLSQWQSIESAPKNRMFIWAAPKGGGEWSLGLAYWTVSGSWRDAYADPYPPERATHWMPLPAPPGQEPKSEDKYQRGFEACREKLRAAIHAALRVGVDDLSKDSVDAVEDIMDALTPNTESELPTDWLKKEADAIGDEGGDDLLVKKLRHRAGWYQNSWAVECREAADLIERLKTEVYDLTRQLEETTGHMLNWETDYADLSKKHDQLKASNDKLRAALQKIVDDNLDAPDGEVPDIENFARTALAEGGA